MPEPRLADRVAILETKMKRVDSFLENFDKTLELRFREQAEMLDERFVLVRGDIGAIQRDIGALRGDMTTLRKDVTILREGMKIILQKLR